MYANIVVRFGNMKKANTPMRQGAHHLWIFGQGCQMATLQQLNISREADTGNRLQGHLQDFADIVIALWYVWF